MYAVEQQYDLIWIYSFVYQKCFQQYKKLMAKKKST